MLKKFFRKIHKAIHEKFVAHQNVFCYVSFADVFLGVVLVSAVIRIGLPFYSMCQWIRESISFIVIPKIQLKQFNFLYNR
jgi:hypothetical protein